MNIEISTQRPPDSDALIHLFRQAGWRDKTDPVRIGAMIENSTLVVTAWDQRRMVGFARCQTDDVYNGQINNVVVDQDYRGLGIGRRLIEKILQHSAKVTCILRADPANIGFYRWSPESECFLIDMYRPRSRFRPRWVVQSEGFSGKCYKPNPGWPLPPESRAARRSLPARRGATIF